MLIVGSIIWVLLLIGLLALVIPSEEMRRDPGANSTYYAVWIILLSLAFFLQYQYMSSIHHRALAITTDVIGLLLFLGLQYLRYRYYYLKEADDDRIPGNRMHRFGRVDLSGICLDPPGTPVDPEEDER